MSKSQLVRITVSQREAGHDPARIRSVRVGFGEARYPLQLVRYSADKAIAMSMDSHRQSRLNQIKTTKASAVVREMQRMGMNSVAAAAMAKAAPLLEAWGKKI
ncbi:MAG: hypothetical protein HKN21_11390 [Candidatus Eisenbacteria bacterium]|uniref:Uncharacterized protein n=1 Tax=Eiseniibacteriota bacterium TaxID=2212470 RepID=A0A7Y2H2T1_UNCEI|nr:hypothetical protein [Candidatus Eisenbacteria bacterium]